MNHLNHLFFMVFTLLLVLGGCSNAEPKSTMAMFNKSDSLSYTVLAEDVFGLSMDMVYNSGCLLVNDLKSDSFLVVFDLNSGKVTQRFLSLGQGPAEAVDNPSSLCMVNDSTLIWLDTRSFIQQAVLSDDKRSIVSISKRCQFDHSLNLLEVAPLADEGYVAVGFFSDGRYARINNQGKIVTFFSDYPDKKSVEDKKVKALVFQGNFVTNQALNRFAFYTYQSDAIDFFALEKGKLQLKQSYRFDVASYTQSDAPMPIIQNGRNFYLNACASDRYVYLLCGDPYVEPSRPQIAGSTLLVFDWNGQPVMRYDLPVKLTALAVDPVDRLLYGAALQPEGAVLAFSLKPIE